MNTYWSEYVQKTEELYLSRALKFHSGNMDKWIDVMQLHDGMNILEVGCAGGLLCHRLKERLQSAEITGVDFDIGHIDFAKKKSAELNLKCNFIAGDATQLPFADNSFDVCYSHTVINFCEPTKFVSEQYRVLKPGGKMIIMDVYDRSNKPEEWIPTDACEEKALFDKVWAAANDNPNSQVKRYENRTEKYFAYLAAQGFHAISIDAMASVNYAPDCDNIDDETARLQINEDRVLELNSVEKAYKMAPHALSKTEYQTLLDFINRRYDKKIKQYEDGEKNWEFRIATTVLISGTK
ncbi:MAG: methyltransferase domain-containing protein [Lachnospiraceae bacterium]|nr:methyltransferase domain-containing protein [Lachnospiraceae bacterium]